MMISPLGVHVLLDFYHCQTSLLNDPEGVKKLLLEAVTEAGMTPLESAVHQYTPQGVSAVILVAESHISIHTWPEYDFAAVDFFSCRNDVDLQAVRILLEQRLHCEKVEEKLIARGEKPTAKE